MPNPKVHFVTGRLAEHSLRGVLAELARRVGFEYTIDVLNITVAALMTPEWIARRIRVPEGTTRVLIPGYCEGDLAPVAAAAGVPVERGPRDLRRLPEFFGGEPAAANYGAHDIQILAEINYAPRLALVEILKEAERLRADGADLIDVGCDPGEPWRGIADAVRALCDAGHRVSIDSMNPHEIEPAVRAGAELVLSVNSSNCAAARDWGCEVVVVPDVPTGLVGLDETVAMLAEAGVPLRIDPVLEPIGFGFAASLERYFDVRRRYPDAEMMMGIGNLTELTDVDSAGVNVLLMAICEELGIRSVLTTQVIPWARTSVRECDLARRLVYHAIRHKMLPKHLEPRLVMLRGGEPLRFGDEALDRLAAEIKDNNYRVFAEDDRVHLVSAGLHLADADPFLLFERLLAREPRNLDLGHAFYLGYEMAKAATALTLGKDYRQDESLDWGFLTRDEKSHRLKRPRASPDTRAANEAVD
jgi:dihydropteroate synthase-like protein